MVPELYRFGYVRCSGETVGKNGEKASIRLTNKRLVDPNGWRHSYEEGRPGIVDDNQTKDGIVNIIMVFSVEMHLFSDM